MLAASPGLGRAAGAPPSAPECAFAVAQVHEGRLIESADAESCRADTGATPIFQAASLAKPIVATLALQMALREQLDLDRPLSELLPDGYVHRQNLFALREQPALDVVPREMLSRLTARRLLSHTAGLPNWSADGPLRFVFPPGTRWSYSGEGYVLLQHLLQVLTGKPLNELASSALFVPLGLTSCALKLTDAVSRSLVPGRTAAGHIRQLRFPFEIAASSLYTSAPDYARFMAATLADQGLLNLVTRDPVPVPGASGVYWGLGWGLEQTAERMALWHWGSNPGCRALAMADVASKHAIVALTAVESGMPRLKSALRQVLPGPHPGIELGLVQ